MDGNTQTIRATMTAPSTTAASAASRAGFWVPTSCSTGRNCRPISANATDSSTNVATRHTAMSCSRVAKCACPA